MMRILPDSLATAGKLIVLAPDPAHVIR